MFRTLSLCSAAALAAAFAMPAAPAAALTMQECSAKYQAAKEADTLKGMKWNDFRKAECGSTDAAAEPEPAAKPAAKPSEKASEKPAAAASGGGLTMKECSAKYQAAKSANKLNGMKWNDFRKAECSDDDASEADAAAAEAAEPAPKGAASGAAPTATTVAKGGFPSDVAPKYANETPGKARMHTCLDQYRANKAGNVSQPKWIEKGGGYYSQCNARLKQGA